MERYTNNGLCNYIKERFHGREQDSEIKFFDTDKSLLVVADKASSKPLCLIIDDRIGENIDPIVLTHKEKEYGNLCYRIAKQAELPLFWIRYIDCQS